MVQNVDLQHDFLSRLYRLPGGRKIDECIQCGTCSSSCPTAFAMTYGPRRVIAAVRAGLLDRVMQSNTVWMCTSCYSCSVRCPAGIPFTDVMYELKRLGNRYGIRPMRRNNAAMARAFVSTVDRFGRNAENLLIAGYYLRTNPLVAFRALPMVARLARKGRAPMRIHRIKGIKGFRRMMHAIEERQP